MKHEKGTLDRGKGGDRKSQSPAVTVKHLSDIGIESLKILSEIRDQIIVLANRSFF